MFGMPNYIHSDRGSSFLSEELTSYLHNYGIATSKTSRYNPQGNGQCERYNGVIWKTIQLRIKSLKLHINEWELVITEALHAIRSLLCTSTNATPHERMFSHPRRSASGVSIPSWLAVPGKVYMKRQVKGSKYEEDVEEVDLLQINPQYAHIRTQNGMETTVSLRHLAPTGINVDDGPGTNENAVLCNPVNKNTKLCNPVIENTNITETESVDSPQLFSEPDNIQQERVVEPRRSKRFRIKPDRLDL